MNTPLRILVVLPLYGGSLPIGRYCAQALRDLGHLVEEFDAPAFQQAHVALRGLRISGERLAQVETAFLNTLSQAVYAKAESFAPDLVLALAQAPLGRQTLRRLRADGVPTAMWFVEDYALFTYWRSFAPLYDFFFVIQKEPFLSLLRETGVENACYLPLAALPSFPSSSFWKLEASAVYPMVSPTLLITALLLIFSPFSSFPSKVSNSKVYRAFSSFIAGSSFTVIVTAFSFVSLPTVAFRVT